MGCGLSRTGRPRQDGGLDRRRTTTDLRIKDADDQYTPVTTPNHNNKGRLQFSNNTAAAGDDGRGGASPQSPIRAKNAQQTSSSSSKPALHDGGHPRLQINTQHSIERRKVSSDGRNDLGGKSDMNNQSDRTQNYEEDEDDDDDGRRISSHNGVQLFVGSPSFREYCRRPGSRSDDMDINEIGNKEIKSGKTQ